MTAITGSITLKQHRLTTKHPTGRTFIIATLGQVVYLTITASIYQSDIAAVPTASTYIAGQQPLAVGTPLKPEIAITIREVILTIKHSAL